ncbi:histidine kinase [Ekhidna sp.]|uniref:sensor histidine kinase n=1 Tax=Ekhidna sp. TaxID=2608089 RepID=UPI0032EDEA18
MGVRSKVQFLPREFSWKKELKEAALIYIFGGAIQLVLWSDYSRINLENFVISFTYSGFFWVMLWKGSEHLVEFLDSFYSWFEHPVKRLLSSLVCITILTVFVVYFLDLMYDVFYFKKGFTEAITDLNGAPLFTTLMVNLGINTFMHGRGFLLEWRQVSIDNEKLKTEQVASQYNSLKNQVNPHFLFNSLNALSSLVYEDQAKAVEFIRKLSQVYRYVLESKDEEVIPLEDEMAFVENFVFLQKIRFGENLNVKLSPSNGQFFVPPLAIQILVENAIKHNVVSEKDPLSIDIEFQDDRCVVRNNIKEKRVKDSTGIGLNNLIGRYSYLTDHEVIVNNNSGIFEVQLPLLKMK